MIAAVVLLAFVVVASTIGSTTLLRATWVHTAPRWGIWSWQVLSVAIASAIVFAAVAVAVPLLPLRSTLARWAQITPLELDEHYDAPGGAWIAGLALALAVSVVVRVAWLTATTIREASRRRRRQAESLALVGVEHHDGYVVVEHTVPLVYCLPGRGRRVVVTSGAAAMLSSEELRLVLAHERTHLRARHDLALALSGALAHTFSPLGVFRDAHQQITRLVEMQADDAARATGDRRVLAGALVTLSVGGPHSPTTGADALARVKRLTTAGPRGLGLRNGVAVGLMTAVLLSTPIGLAVAPAIEASTRDCCDDPDL